MQTKLTLRLEERLIERAKEYARKRGTSLSQLVTEYFALLEREAAGDETLPPTVAKLRGSLKHAGIDADDYRTYLEDKYR